jgi:DHA1 family tetracycline resistance protein-like MFS transporter
MKNKFQILPLLTVIFIDSVGWGIVYPVFSAFLLTSSQSNSNAVFEIVISIYSVCMFLFSPLLGALSDNHGRKKLLLISMIGSGVGFVISALGLYFSTLSVLLAGRVISGMTAGSLGIAQAAIADLSNTENKANRIGYIVIANGLGFTCGPLLGALLINVTPSLFISMLFTGTLSAIGALIVFYFFDETHTPLTTKIDLLSSLKNLLQVGNFPNLKKIFICLFITMLGYITFFNYLPIFLHQRFNYSGNQQGYFLGYYAILFSASLCYFLPKLQKRFPLSKLVYTAIIFHSIFYLICFTATSAKTLYAYVIPISVFAPIMYVGLVTLLSNQASPTEQGKVMGIVGSICALTWALGPLLVASLTLVSFIAPVLISVAFLISSLLILSANSRQKTIALSS